MGERNFIYFINPIAGPGRDPVRIKQLISSRTEERGFQYKILETNAEGDYSALPAAIARDRITDLVICGGDGTINKVVAALLNTEVNIGILPVGSGNGLAFSARIPASLNGALDIIFQGKTAQVDAFYINQQFSCMLCGIGMDAQVAYEFALGTKRGLATYIRASIRNFFTYAPYRYSMLIEENKISGSAYFISVANSNQFGNNFTIAPRASLSDGLLDIIIVSAMSKPRLLFSILNQLRFGKALPKHEVTNDLKGIIYFQTDNLIIDNPDYARLHIDGDPAKTDNHFSIRVLPKAFTLLVP